MRNCCIQLRSFEWVLSGRRESTDMIGIGASAGGQRERAQFVLPHDSCYMDSINVLYVVIESADPHSSDIGIVIGNQLDLATLGDPELSAWNITSHVIIELLHNDLD